MTAAGATNSPMTRFRACSRHHNDYRYAKAVAQMAYAWGWPMVNIQSRRLMYAQVPMKGTLGPLPVAPLNELAMLPITLTPTFALWRTRIRMWSTASGFLPSNKNLLLSRSGFRRAFWMYQICDQRTDSFASFGSPGRSQGNLFGFGGDTRPARQRR